MGRYICGLFAVLLFFITCTTGQRITTIQLDGVQYFVSRMNPYSPELNYFLAYQYCRSLGLQLASFETKEKADSITQYLKNAGYDKFDFWTSGNRLGTDMFLWMSTGLPFNATFNYMKKSNDEENSASSFSDIPIGSTSPQRTARESSDSGSSNGCVVLRAPNFKWDTDDCVSIKDFICEQTRCYYYNYGSIPVSTAQGKSKFTTPYITKSTTTPKTTTIDDYNNDYIQIKSLLSKLRSQSTKVKSLMDDSAINLNIFKTNSNNNKHSNNNNNNSNNRKDIDLEQATNGPYDNFNLHAELQDDPSANLDHNGQEGYVSTIEPEKITTIMGFNPSNN